MAGRRTPAGGWDDYLFVVDHGPSRLVTWTGGCLGTGADTVLGVYPLGADDAPGEAVARDDDGGAGACSRLDLDLAPGRYLLRVQGFGAAPAALDRYTLDYRLTVDARVRGRFAGQYAPSGDDRFRFAIPERSGFACGDRAIADAVEAAGRPGIRFEARPVIGLVVEGRLLTHVTLSDGEQIPCEVLYAHPPQRQVGLVQSLAPLVRAQLF